MGGWAKSIAAKTAFTKWQHDAFVEIASHDFHQVPYLRSSIAIHLLVSLFFFFH